MASWEKGDRVAGLEALLVEAVRHGLRERFADAIEAKKGFTTGNVAAGRAFVAAYVPLLHYAERLHATASAAGHAESEHAKAGAGAHPSTAHSRR